jgi:hypothetical protein
MGVVSICLYWNLCIVIVSTCYLCTQFLLLGFLCVPCSKLDMMAQAMRGITVKFFWIFYRGKCLNINANESGLSSKLRVQTNSVVLSVKRFLIPYGTWSLIIVHRIVPPVTNLNRINSVHTFPTTLFCLFHPLNNTWRSVQSMECNRICLHSADPS